MNELIVIAAHGPDYIGGCRASLADCPTRRIVIDTGSGTVPEADVTLPGGHPTAAYRWAYDHWPTDRYLFIQDSMLALKSDVTTWFREQMPADVGAVAWGKFPEQWDNTEQRHEVEAQYPGIKPGWGILGPIFYASRAALDVLAASALFPRVPETRLQAQGTERGWAYAFTAAGIPVAGPTWEPERMKLEWGPFRKVWANRP